MTHKITDQCAKVDMSCSIIEREVLSSREACWCLKEFCNEESFLQQLMKA